MTNTTNRVWIEIEKSDDDKVNKKRAELFTKMINRLRGDDAEVKAEVFWYKEKHKFAYSSDHLGSCHTLDDNGEWFNLDFCGRD